MAFQHSYCWTFISLILNVLLILCDGQVTSSVQDQVKCTGDNITINWAYNTASQLVTTWQFESSTIMTGAGLSTPIVDNAYIGRATHGGNGVLTLSGLTPADTGTYTIRIDYSAAPTLARDSVAVTVYDKITQASTPQCGTDTVTCGSASMSDVSYSWKVGNAVVPQVSWSISLRSGTNTYECTISGNRVTNCLDAGVGTTQSTNCTFKGKPCDTTCVIIICVVVVVIYVLGIGAVLIVLAVVRRFCKTCPCCEEYTGIGCRAICVIIGTSLGMGIIVAVVILIVLGIEKKLPCQKGEHQGVETKENSLDLERAANGETQ